LYETWLFPKGDLNCGLWVYDTVQSEGD